MIRDRELVLFCIFIAMFCCILVPVTSAATETLDAGTTKTAAIDVAGEVDTYLFPCTAGDGVVARITRTSGDLYPRITLFGPSGKEVAKNYGISNAEVQYVLTDSGTCKVLIDNGISTAYTGDYSLFIQTVNDPGHAQPVSFSETATGSISIPGSIDTYSFTGSVGDQVLIRITRTTGDLYPRITLFGPTGKEIKKNYGISNAELSSTLTKAGTYSILVDNGISTAYTGDYSLYTVLTSGSSTGNNPASASAVTTPSRPATVSTTSAGSAPATSPDTPGKPSDTLLLPLAIGGVVLLVIGGAGYSVMKSRQSAPQQRSASYSVKTAPVPGSPAKGAHHDVFISYASRDKPVADAICNYLESRQIRCWIAPRDILPGMQYQESIIDAIDSSFIFVLVFSADSNESPHVLTEVNEAMSNKDIIIPFRVEDVQPSKSMKYLIGVPHWLDAIDPPMSDHIRKLEETIRVLLQQQGSRQ